MALTYDHKRLQEISRGIGTLNYRHYREFLADLFKKAKQEDPRYSFARLSADLGLGSNNAHSIIHGHRRLGVKGADRLCKRLALVGVHRRYLLALVREEGARTPAQRDAAFSEQFAAKRLGLENAHSRQQLAFFEHWHHVAILELLRFEHASDDAAWISANLQPVVPVALVSESLQLLKDLSYVSYDSVRGRLYPTQVKVTSSPESYPLALASFHRQMLALGAQALDCIDPKERLFGSVTLALPRQHLAYVREEIAQLRSRLQHLAATAEGADSLVQVNIQMFPIATKK